MDQLYSMLSEMEAWGCMMLLEAYGENDNKCLSLPDLKSVWKESVLQITACCCCCCCCCCVNSIFILVHYVL